MTSVSTVGDPVNAREFVRVIRSVDDLSGVRDYWQSCRLPRDMDIDRYFYEISTSTDLARPHVLVYYESGRPKALMVGRYEVKSSTVRLGYLRIPTGKVRSLTFLSGGVIGEISAQACSQFIDNIYSCLRAGEADAVTIHYCEVESPLVSIARSRAAKLVSARFQRVHVHTMRALVDDTTSSPIALSNRERQRQRRREKALQGFRGQVRIAHFSAESDVDRLASDVETVAKRTYQRGLQVGFSDTPRIRDLLRFDARMGWLHAYVLYIEEHPCAFWITGIYRGTLYSDYLGFDPAYGRYAPGLYLLVDVISHLSTSSADPPVRLIDFGVGDAEYKVRLGNRSQLRTSLSLFAPSARGLTLNALQTSVSICHVGAERLLKNSQRLARLKRAWRDRLQAH